MMDLLTDEPSQQLQWRRRLDGSFWVVVVRSEAETLTHFCWSVSRSVSQSVVVISRAGVSLNYSQTLTHTQTAEDAGITGGRRRT